MSVEELRFQKEGLLPFERPHWVGGECSQTIILCEEFAMDENRRLAGFKALLASQKANSHQLEEPDGSFRLWRDLSPEGRLGYIVRDAALYNVPFERFAEAVRESVDSAVIEEASLRLAMRSGQELYDLESLFPDDGRTESTSLVERVGELLNAKSADHENEGWLTTEDQAALFKEMWADYAAAKGEDAHGRANEAFQRILDGKAKGPVAGKGKDNGIER